MKLYSHKTLERNEKDEKGGPHGNNGTKVKDWINTGLYKFLFFKCNYIRQKL